MNKIYGLGLLALLILAVFSTSLVVAKESNSDADSVSGLRYGWEKFKMGFIRNETIRAEKELQLARWKLAEANEAFKRGNIERAEKALEKHEALLEKLRLRIDSWENRSLTPGLNQAIMIHEERIANLTNLLGNTNLTDEQRERVERRIIKLQNNTLKLDELRERISERRQDKLERIENRTNRIEKRGDRIEERIENRTNSTNKNDFDDNEDGNDDLDDRDEKDDDSNDTEED